MVIVMNKKGFTLIEVIMVIAIIAILSIILTPNVMVFINKNNKKSCEKMRKQQGTIVFSALLWYNIKLR